MNAQAEILKKRSKQFALDVLAFVRTLPASDEARSTGGQLIRSATGLASNYRAACRSRSTVEFVARVGVALEEADESALWLEIMIEAGIRTTTDALRLMDEAMQLSAILAQSRITASNNLERGRREAQQRRPAYVKKL